ncbi:hypothetical protein PILCRDRAFT_11312 [Piloderma croceum F 1598]|uniref:Uncharacterized protein n=1 Tax=Piloderma croceum (strain F 1598) TaxID=765440 RepID=A0A0C3F0L6_PILCF|nr:hypothetical protein PILCRDRAFT_11312 [Piloderma croceum F 1598]
MGGGAVTPQHPSPPPAAPLQPETELPWLGFGFFSPNPLRASRCANAQPHHHHHIVCTTTPPIRTVPRRRFTRAPKIEPRRLGFGFIAQTPSLASRLRTQCPIATTASSTPLHHLLSPLSIPISNGPPKIEPQWLDFGFLALRPLSRLAFANAMPRHYHHLISTTTPPPSATLHPHF